LLDFIPGAQIRIILGPLSQTLSHGVVQYIIGYLDRILAHPDNVIIETTLPQRLPILPLVPETCLTLESLHELRYYYTRVSRIQQKVQMVGHEAPGIHFVAAIQFLFPEAVDHTDGDFFV
jgi:hypothetical protein